MYKEYLNRPELHASAYDHLEFPEGKSILHAVDPVREITVFRHRSTRAIWIDLRTPAPDI
jgi:hypothetical protein